MLREITPVLPADPSRPRDVRAAEEVRVEQVAGAVHVVGHRWKQYLPFSSGTTSVTVEVPDALGEEQARLEVELYIKAWQASHPDVEAHLRH